jgi:hypothetical protein
LLLIVIALSETQQGILNLCTIPCVPTRPITSILSVWLKFDVNPITDAAPIIGYGVFLVSFLSLIDGLFPLEKFAINENF